ncbi:MAG: nucleoside-diphosphate sugar epimerase/dehydratase [Burkholderiales bacterium]
MNSPALNRRALLAFGHDVVMSVLAWMLAFWLRFNLDIPADFLQVLVHRLPYVALVHAVVFWALGLYRGLWRYASLPDLQRIVVAVGVSALAVPALLSLLRLGVSVPRSVYLIAPILLAGAMSGSRLLYRAWKERRVLGVIRHPEANPVLVLGAGTAAAALLKDLANSREWRVVGLLDDDPAKRGGEIVGVKILGPLDAAGETARRLDVAHAIIAMPGATHSLRKRAVDLCAAAGLRVMTVPAYADIVSGRISVSALRKVELDDLLGRDPVQLDDAGLHGLLGGKVVMVTGAGGSIGAELCRQIARFEPKLLLLFELNEYALYSIEEEFRAGRRGVPIACVIGDVKNAVRIEATLARYRPSVVFHAAAYKHVPLMEIDNAWEAVQNNVLGTLRLARAAQAHGVEKFVLISTDKAVNPTNVMGASKRLSEQACQALQREAGAHFVMVRFGNVLGSTGSVIPKFREQIARGGPVTVTHPEITRYFMSISEAAQLVLQAGWMGRGGEIFVLEMGEPVRIVDLARDMIRLSGLGVEDIRIEFTGLRPGEKLYEELLSDRENTLPTPHPKLRIATADGAPGEAWLADLERWLAQPRCLGDDEVKRELTLRVPEYKPAG